MKNFYVRSFDCYVRVFNKYIPLIAALPVTCIKSIQHQIHMSGLPPQRVKNLRMLKKLSDRRSIFLDHAARSKFLPDTTTLAH